MPKAPVNGVDIYYEVEGAADRPWLTFSNSLRTDHTMWSPQIPAFASDFRILRYDVRGHGQSGHASGKYSADLLCRDLIGLWDYLGIGRSHFVGLSLGGMTGMRLGMQFAHRIDKLVICDCRGDSPPAIVETWAKRCEAVQASGCEVLVEESVNSWFSAEQRVQQADFIAAIGRSIAETSAEGYIGCASGILSELDMAERITQIKPQTLFLVGSKDGPHPTLMRSMHEGLRGSDFVVIEGGTHLANLSHPVEFNAAVRTFLMR